MIGPRLEGHSHRSTSDKLYLTERRYFSLAFFFPGNHCNLLTMVCSVTITVFN